MSEGSNLADYLLVIVTFIAACIVIWQVGREYRHSLSLQQKNFKDRIKHEIFIELSEGIHDCSTRYNSFGSLISSIPEKYSFQLTQKELGLRTKLVDIREPKIHKSSSKATKSYIHLLFLLEKYEIALPQISAARLIIDEHLYKLLEMTRYHDFFRDYIPIDVPEDRIAEAGATVFVRKEVDKKTIKQMEDISKEYNNLIFEMVSFMEDLRVIMQNELLGNLFDRKLRGRTLNPSKYTVLKTDSDENMKELKRKLLKDGHWGKAVQRTQHGINLG